jgi:hypothetical protein
MKSLHGPRHSDKFTRDIKEAIKEGYFDSPDRMDNELTNTPVKQLLKDVAMMSPRERKRYLAKLGGIRTGTTMLTQSEGGRDKRTKWLSR